MIIYLEKLRKEIFSEGKNFSVGRKFFKGKKRSQLEK